MQDPDSCPNGTDMLTRQCMASPSSGRSRCNSSMACMIRIHTRWPSMLPWSRYSSARKAASVAALPP